MNAPSVSGCTIGDAIAGAEKVPAQDVIRTLAAPLTKEGAMAVLHGNLAPGSAVIKQSAASPNLMRHTGRAVVFDGVEDMTSRIDNCRISMYIRKTFWSCAMQARRARRACRKQAICPSR